MTSHPDSANAIPGEPRLHFGSLANTRLGRLIVILLGVVVVLGVVLIGVGVSSLSISVVLALVSSVMGAVVVAVGVLALQQYLTTTVTLDERGIHLAQPWFVRREIPWTTVAVLMPPGREIREQRFDIALHTGERQIVTRLSLAPQPVGHGLIHHPDVQAALDFHADWQQRTASSGPTTPPAP